MTLLANVTSRIDSTRLIHLTNPNDPTASTVNSAKLQSACNDVEADFSTVGQVAYDDTNAQHVSVAVRGVVEKLKIWMGQAEFQPDGTEAWHKMLIQIRETGPRARIMPDSNSVIEPTPVTAGSKPVFDRRLFGNIIPSQPSPLVIEENGE
jgi:hypothetical protein